MLDGGSHCRGGVGLLLGRTGDAVGGGGDALGVVDQPVGIVIDFADQLAQRIDHAAQRGEQAAGPWRIQGGSQIAVGHPAHDIDGEARFAAQLVQDAAADLPAEKDEDDQQGGRYAAENHRAVPVGGIDIVNVDAGPDDPFPRGEQGGVGKLRLGDLLPGTGEPVIDEFPAARPGIDQFAHEQLAVGVFHVALVLAFEFRLAREENVLVPGVDDEEIVPLVVAHVAQAVAGGDLGLFLGELAAGRQLLVVGQDAQADLDQVPGFLLAIFEHGALELQEGAEAKNE